MTVYAKCLTEDTTLVPGGAGKWAVASFLVMEGYEVELWGFLNPRAPGKEKKHKTAAIRWWSPTQLLTVTTLALTAIGVGLTNSSVRCQWSNFL